MSWLFFFFFCDNLQQVFYGPKYRRMGLGLGLARLGVLRNLVHAQRKGYHGNKNGEGFILGGLYVIGAEKQVRQSVVFKSYYS